MQLQLPYMTYDTKSIVPGVVKQTHNPSTQETKQEDIQVSLGHVVKSYLQ